ncbi:MAG: 50S ribosomal protein L21 [Chitinivibrionales bacterium]|nr:50S ribosomal protein L21 [Chitinivibrionales bacterium]
MQSIVECGGFQYKVAVGDVIKVPQMKAEAGSEVTLDRVLATTDGAKSTFGTPTVDGVAVKATVLEHGRYPKILVIKKKRRKDYKRKNGHRQSFTKLQITAIG